MEDEETATPYTCTCSSLTTMGTALVLMNGDPDARSGGVTARVYHEVLHEHLQMILNADSIFMHDNAPIHTANIIQGFL
jgi:hypothetical protein